MNAPNLLKPQPTAPEPLLVNTRDAARLLGVSVRTVEKLRAKGTLPVVRVPHGGPRFELMAIRRLIEAWKDS